MFDTCVDWDYHTEPQSGCRGRRIFWPRGRMIGGSGALNAMIYMRGLPSDYDGWEAMGCPGWGWRDVLPDVIGFENNRRLGTDPLHGAGGPLHVEDCPYTDEGEHIWMDAAVSAGDCRTDEEIARHVRGHCMSLYHPSSTCRMGTDTEAVVDPGNFAVHGLDGLHVADASVFPRMISANLNATVILIAEHAAKALV